MNNNTHQIRNSLSTILPRTKEEALRCPPVSSGGSGHIPNSDTSALVDEIMRTNPGYRSALEKILSVTNRLAASKDSSREMPSTPAILNSALCTPNSEDWINQLNACLCPSARLGSLNVPDRQPILGQWLRQGDLGFIYGPRGLGKTWLALHIARQCADGGQVGPWKAEQPCPVLYIDGEMPLDDIRQRDAILSTSRSVLECGSPLPLSPTPDFQPSVNDPANRQSTGVLYLQHEALFHNGGKVLNLALPEIQNAILHLCRQHGVQLLFLDNLSCLFSGLKENDADAWEQVLPWLLNLRRNRIAVVFIAHASRSGTMRGTSRREDAAFWVIQLSETREGAPSENQSKARNGAQFVARFVKNRNSTGTECPDIEWHFSTADLPGDQVQDSELGTRNSKQSSVSWRRLSNLEIFRQCIELGLTRATDIAQEMGISKGQASKLAKQAERSGWLKIQGKEYVLTTA